MILKKNNSDLLQTAFLKAEKALPKLQGFLNRLYEKKKHSWILISACGLFIFVIMFLINHKSLMHGDDFIYSFIFHSNTRISDFADIIQSQIVHYNEWGGRSVVHVIAQLVLTFPPFIIDILNAAAFLLLIICLYYHAKGKGKASPSAFIGAFFLVWILQPGFADTLLWITGSVNYLWGTTIILSFLLPYRFYDGKNHRLSINIVLSVIFLIWGIIAGWTTENTGAAMIVMILLFFIYYRWNGWKVPAWLIFGFIGAVIGYTMMIAAPGNFIRAAKSGPLTFFRLAFNTFSATQAFVTYLAVFAMVLCILYVIYIKFSGKNKKKTSALLLIYLLGAFVSIYAMVASPSFPPRSWFGPICLFIIVFGIVYYNLNTQLRFIQYIKGILVLFGSIIFLFSFYSAYKDINEVEKLRYAQLQQIMDAKAKGETHVEIEMIRPKTKYALMDARYVEESMSMYYDIEIKYK